MSPRPIPILVLAVTLAIGARGSWPRNPEASPPAPAELITLVPRGAVWRYLDNGSDQGSSWRSLAFDDSDWDSGPAQLGYGDGDEATVVSYGSSSRRKHITTYFRHTFQIPGPDVGGLRIAELRLLRDDGAVVYLNGVEVVRSNMPSGGIDHDTLAPSTIVGDDEDLFHTVPFDSGLLQNGPNVLAVEIHQEGQRSSDLSFDLEVVASTSFSFLVRGPYLQSGTPESAVFRWRSNVPTESAVWVGTAGDEMWVGAVNSLPTTEHEATVMGLEPDTQYYYAIHDGGDFVAGPDADHTFTTPPAIGTSKPTRIWVIGDSGRADAKAAAVREGFLNHTGDRGADVWLMLGDNAYEDGLDDEYQAAVFDMYPSILRETFLWPTLGNHDAQNSDSTTGGPVYYDIFSLPEDGRAGGLPSGTEAYYSFDHGDIHFICLDSHDTDRSPTGAMMNWLEADLAATSARWIIAFWHHPPYSDGSHDSDDDDDSDDAQGRPRMREMREFALPILEAGGVDLVLTGHSHSYERSFPLDGHYGKSYTLESEMMLDHGDGSAVGDGAYGKPTVGPGPNEGAVYAVVGSSALAAGGPLEHPAMFLSLDTLGSMVIDIDDDRLEARFIDSTGAVQDEFAVVKGVARSLVRGEPRISLSAGGTQELFLDAGPENAGKSYVLAGSLGTEPGFDAGSVHVPLNLDDWMNLSLDAANGGVYQNTVGLLDDNGKAQAAIVLPTVPDPSFVGLVLYHAYVVYEPEQLLLASNPVKLTLTH